ncbi:MAG: hypothetical protein KKE30_07230 [Gammaproteobacteria bacterium]|nr:hypothetical protein [Gammaproteobacteria bacterium]MBU1555794.1 hypothetical protein [Gammaproteobacteria bacterium]MBU2069680.1 hypothetical protein [Gammaproteobacteria bacterium]MBU2184545.1 hypothetical protein [Gammaproteobacteria bacterium]MBU2205227.1 hypothetical protein [Gammaproteobacteria bacterium]
MKNKPLLLALLAILLVAKFVLVPWLEWVSQKTATINQLKLSEMRLSNVQQRSAQLLAQQKAIDENYASLESVWLTVPQSQRTIQILKHLETEAKQANVELNARNTGQVDERDAITIPASVFVRGTPQNIYRLIAQLESGSPRILFSGVRLVKANAAAGEITGTLDLLVPLAPGDVK